MINSNETAKRKLEHPLWTHLPAVAALAVFLGYLIYVGPLPANAPVHFGPGGVVDAYGSPWTFLGIIIGFSLFFIGLSIFLDELWVRQEKKKSFNWFCLLDEAVVGWMVGMGLGYLAGLHNDFNMYDLPWVFGLVTAGAALVLAVILESLRPFHPHGRHIEPADTADFKASIVRQIKDDSRFIYWESQDPFFITLLSLLMPLIFIGSALVVWIVEGGTLYAYAFGAAMILIGVFLMLFTFGGQRIIAARQSIMVRWGAVGLRVLRVDPAEIASAEIMEFSPLRDFGGYGIRFGRGVTAYYLRGSRGVKITMLNGKKYLLGSDNPERLLTVVDLLAGNKA